MREWMTTPSVMVDEKRVRRNVAHMQQLASTHHVQLRPHVKTHKTLELAGLQLQHGACGLTTSKPSEALRFFESKLPGLQSILLAYPVVQEAKLITLLAKAQESGIEFRLTIDSREGLDAIESASIANGNYKPKVLIHIDVGYHRVGMDEHDPRLLEYAQRIHDSPHLEFQGILSHAGHAYACTSVAECATVGEQERAIMVRIRDAIQASGVPVPTVSCGSTLTELARKNFDGITEIRPGNYVFLDRTPVRIGLTTIQNVSLGVLTTVVSANAHYFIVDAGSKVLSSDAPRSGSPDEFGAQCFGLAILEKDFDLLEQEPTSNKYTTRDGHDVLCWEVKKLSEEHGWIKQIDSIPTPAIGSKMVILPNHSCVVANLTDQLYIQGTETKTWKTVSRGCTQ